MAVASVFASSGDGYVRNHGSSAWGTLQAAATGTSADSSSAVINFTYNDGTTADKYIDRGFFAFDLSALPAGAAVTQVRLYLYVDGVYTGAGGAAGVTEASQASTSTLATSDFDNVTSTEYATRKNFSGGFSAGAYNYFDFTTTGKSAVASALGGTFKCAVRGSFDIDNSAPGTTVYSGIYGKATEETGTAKDPYLEVTYTTDATVAAVPLAATVSAPAPLVYGNVVDTFTDTNGTDLETHVPENGAWTRLYPTPSVVRLKITSNRVYTYTTSGVVSATYVHSTPVANGAVEVPMQVLSTAGYAGVWYRRTSSYLTAAGDGYLMLLDGGAWTAAGYVRLLKVSSGTTTELGSYNIGALSGTYTLRLEAVGSSLTVYVDGTSRISVTDATFTSGYVGLSMNSPDGTLTSVAIQPTSITLADPQTVVAGTPLAASVALPAPTVTTTSPNVTVTSPALAVAVSAPSPTVNGRLTVTTSGSAQTRSANSAAVAAFTGGTIGTATAHYAFPTGVEKVNGDRLLIVREGTAHASYDGIPVAKTSTDGVTWSTKFTPTGLNVSGEDYRSGTVKRLANGDLAIAYFTRRSGIFPSDVYTDGYRAYFARSTDDGATWSRTRITGMTSISDETNATEDFVELADGTLLAAACGVKRSPQDTYFSGVCARSTDGGSTWTDGGVIAAGSTYSAGVVEPQVTVLTSGLVYVSFHIENAPDSGGGQTNYRTTSTTTAATAWNTPAVLLTGQTNISRVMQHSDGDVILAHWPISPYAMYFRQSTDGGVTYGSAIAVGSGGSGFSYDVWPAPFEIGTPGVTPNLAIGYGLENGAQSQANVYYREFTRGSSAQTFGGSTETNLAATVALPVPTIITSSGSASATITAVPLAATVTQPAAALGSGTGMTITAVPLALSSTLSAPIIVTTTGMPPASVSVAALPGTSSVALPVPAVLITGPGTLFVVHTQGMVPGTTIGAYRRWEWLGPVAAKLNAGPGAAVQTTTVAADLTASFTLPPGEYVAYASAYPTKRLFFMVTE